jgi:uncharacterized membrane protein
MSKFSWASLPKQIVGRIDKVKLLRDIILIFVVFVLGIVFPFVNEMLKPDELSKFSESIGDNYIIWILLAIPFLVLILMACYINQIDTWEDAKAITRHNELKTGISIPFAVLNGNFLTLREDMHQDSQRVINTIEALTLAGC